MGIFGPDIDVVDDARVRVSTFELIEKASEELVIVSPYVDVGANIVRVIEGRVRANVRVELIFRRDREDEYRNQSWFTQFQSAGVVMSSVERLHSKVLLTERTVLMGSANFMEGSWKDSRELCVAFERKSEPGKQIVEHVERLRRDAARLEKRSESVPDRRGQTRAARGHCIGCGDSLELNPKRPSCGPCFDLRRQSRSRSVATAGTVAPDGSVLRRANLEVTVAARASPHLDDQFHIGAERVQVATERVG